MVNRSGGIRDSMVNSRGSIGDSMVHWGRVRNSVVYWNSIDVGITVIGICLSQS